MNYLGFSKILKKHDKVTKFATRKKYMTNMVHKQTFTHHPKLTSLIHQTEEIFQQLSSSCHSSPPNANSPAQQSFSEVKTLNEEISRIKKSASSGFFSEGQQLQLLAHQAEKIARLDREQGVEQGSSDGRQKKRQKTETWEKPSK